MNHARADIRALVIARLAAGGTAAGARVHEHPTDPRTAFPALQVEDLGEQQQSIGQPAGPQRLVERTLLLEVTAELQQTGAYARARDELVADVERLLMEQPLPGVREVRHAGYAPETVPGERPIAIGRQRFELFYITTAADPATVR